MNGIDAIGALKTFFGNIGRARCRELHTTDRFLVAQAADVLLDSAYSNDTDVVATRERVTRYKRLFGTSASDPRVTIVQSQNDCLIVDGNKTAIAAFLHASDNPSSVFALPVYFLLVEEHAINWIL